MRKINRLLVSLSLSLCAIALYLSMGATAYAQTETVFNDSAVVDTGKQFDAINSVMQEMFWRARANDNTVFYENEFPYLRVDMTVDKYLTGVRFRQQRAPNSDSLSATRLDSVMLNHDTAIAYLTTFAGDTLDVETRRVYSTPQKLYYFNGRWIHPLSTTHRDQEIYMDRIRNYEEAIEREDGN